MPANSIGEISSQPTIKKEGDMPEILSNSLKI